MERQPPRATSDEIDLYIRTYYSLLRSSGDVKVRAFEEAHVYSNSSLHAGARDARPDMAAFAYSSARLPECMPRIRLIVLGQSHEQFEAAHLHTQQWERVRSRGRRRPMHWDGAEILATFVTSTSDIDDLVPMITAYQIEWNKMHAILSATTMGRTLADAPTPLRPSVSDLAAVLGITAEEVEKLQAALGPTWPSGLREIARHEIALSVRLLNGSFAEYQKAAQRWWSGLEPAYVQDVQPRRRPVYFVSSNSHSITNLLGGYARLHREEILAFARAKNPENLAPALELALKEGREDDVSNITYFLLRAHIHEGSRNGGPDRRALVQRFDAEGGIQSIESPGHIDVSAQVIDIARLKMQRVDPRVLVPGFDLLAKSDAVIVNIDYPLGMAAYHHLSRVAQGVGEFRGVYLMGKAATLNGRVGDAMVSNVVHDEHSKNTYLFKNCFTSADIQPYLRHGTVLDNQKAVSVRSTFLQNREYMSVFYREGFTVLEMEAGPYLSAIYELVNPKRHPNDEIAHLATQTPFDVGLLHYASDTPYSRRQTLLSKSLSYFGVDSTYACSVAIVRRILEREATRLQGTAHVI
jgi:hypothetical protein